MRLERYSCVLVLILSLLVASCEKAERPLNLPPAGAAAMAQVNMGEDYDSQIFFDFETGAIVHTSSVNSWDLAFENTEEGCHVFINGGKNIFVYNSGATDPSTVKTTSSVGTNGWNFDAPCGLSDSTGIGDWRLNYGPSKNEVYLLKFQDKSYKKIVIRSVNATEYVLDYGSLDDDTLTTIHIPKDSAFNYAYFSFDNGGQLVQPEPLKSTWDIVFTRYRYVYYDLNNFPYLVSGVLTNPNNTTALADSTQPFANIGFNSSLSLSSFSDHRDVIGFEWKKFNFTSGEYEVNVNKCYVVKTRKNQYWKLHFLDFYSTTGVKGSPSFEYEQIQ